MNTFLRTIEDGWYKILDRIDPIIPVYKVIDPIDKVVPSMYVALFLLLLAGAWLLTSQPAPIVEPTTVATLYFVDEHENPLVGLPIAITIEGRTTSHTSNETGKLIIENVKLGTTIHVHVESNQFDSLDSSYTVKKTNPIISFTLNAKPLPSQPLVFQLVSGGNQLLEGVPITVTVSCPQNPSVNTLTYPITDGVFHFENPQSCDAWYGTFTGEGYQTVDNILLDSTHPLVMLKPIVYVTGTIQANILSGKEHTPLAGIEVQRYTANGVFVESIITTNKGLASFSNVEYGDYYLSIHDPTNTYSGTTTETFSVASITTNVQTFYLLPIAFGNLSLSVKDAETQNPITDAIVKIQQTSDTKILLTNHTDEKGTIPTWSPEQKGTYRIIVTHNGYLSETQQVIIEEEPVTLTYTLHAITPQNAASINVHLTDMQDIPLSSAQLVVYESTTQSVVQSSNPILTNANGNGTFEGLTPGSYFVRAHLYPYNDVETNPLLITTAGTHDVVIKMDTSPGSVSDSLIPPPDFIPDTIPSITPCTENCLPSLIVNFSSTKIPAFDPAIITITVSNTEDELIPGAKVYISHIGENGNKTHHSTKTTNQNGISTINLPASSPGTVFSIFVYHPDFEPIESLIGIQNAVVEISPPTITYAIPYGPSISQSQLVLIKNNASASLRLTDTHLVGNIGQFLDYWKMKQLVETHTETFLVESGETTPLALEAITLPTIAAILNAKENGTFILTFQSLATNQKWVQEVPFNATLETIGSCDGDTLLVNGLGPNNEIEMGAFEAINKKNIQLANGCKVNGQPIPLQNLKGKVDWSSIPLGLVQVEIIDPVTNKKTIETLKNGEYVTLLNNFNPSSAGAYPVTLVFVPQTVQPGSAASFTLTFAAESGVGEGKITLSKVFPISIALSNLETCVKLYPEASKGITFTEGTSNESFRVDTSNCHIPVTISFCPEANNIGCSGGSSEGKIKVTPAKITNLIGETKITIERTDETLPGTYDITVHAKAGGADHLLGRIEVTIRADESYAFSMEKTAFTMYGKGGKDSTDVINNLLKEQVAVTSGVCEWMEVATNTTGAFWGGFAASAIVSGTLVYVVGLGSVVGQFAILGLAICPVCSIIGIIVGIIVQLLLTGSEDICDMQLTIDTMNDWVINLRGVTLDGEELLKPDALDVVLMGPANDLFNGKWVIDKSENIDDGEKGKQIVGVMYTNNSGYTNPTPLFAVTVLRATEHIHGDPEHEDAAVTCDKGTFEDGKIGADSEQGSCDAEDIVREEKFHIKIKTAETTNLAPNIKAESFACQTGYVSGQTGIGALPRVAFNWGWNENTGIPLYGCDASNPSGIYCDAVQMNIDVMKRVRALEDFLQANNYQFDCPDDPTGTPESATANLETEVAPETIGITQYGYTFISPTRIRYSMTVKNNTLVNQKIGFTAKMSSAMDIPASIAGIDGPLNCKTEGILSSGNAFAYTCDIDGIAPLQYGIVLSAIDLTGNTPIGVHNLGIDVKKYQKDPSPICPDQPKTTASIGGKPGINEWADATDEQFGEFVNDNDVKFTAEVPSIDALNRLLHYEANLIQDGYSIDFEQDFKDYYANTSFADAPFWYKGSSSVPGYAKLYGESDTLTFRNKYFEGTTIPASGRYHVDIDVDIDGEDWRFFEENGESKVHIEVNLLHLNDPSPNSPFYRLPFDGQVGIKKDQFDREGYGLNFINQNGTIHLNDEPVITYANTTGTTYSTLTIQQATDFKTINTVPETRGQVLYVTTPTGTGGNSLVFSPSLATPVMMRIEHPKGNTPFSMYYQVAEGGNPLQTGQNLTFWNGSAACMDYSGLLSNQAFSVTPDRAGKLEDKRTDWALVYALDWTNVVNTGDVYLESIFYTPTTGDYTILAASPNVDFLTSNYESYSSGQILDGTLGLTYNNESSAIDSIQDIFDLVANQSICVQDTGVSARFVWNAPALYAQMGQTSIVEEWEKISQNQLCIETTQLST